MDFPNIDPIAFSIGPVAVRWYALAYIAGFILGWRYCLSLIRFLPAAPHPSAQITKDNIDELLSWLVIGVILGGRTGYVLFYQLDYYLEYPSAIYKIWHGGMSFHGGLAGAGLAAYLFSRWRNYPMAVFLSLTDLVAAAAPIGLFFGRIANFINGELFGRASDVPWAIIFPGGGDIARHPSQLYEAGLEGAALGLILYLCISWIRKGQQPLHKPGMIAGLFLIGYGFFRFIVEFAREPDAHLGYVLSVLTMGQILCLPMILLGMGLVYWSGTQHKKAT